MGLRFFIARRFLFSKKSHSVINIISVISIFSVAIITAAMVIILSGISGFEQTIKTIYSGFDPQIKIEATKGKTFLPDQKILAQLQKSSGIEFVCPTIEEICILKNGDNWLHATIKGVPSDFLKMTGLEKKIDGEAVLAEAGQPFLIPGSLVGSKLNAYSEEYYFPEAITVYTPLRSKKISASSNAFNETAIPIAGIFKLSPEIDEEYILTDLSALNDMMNYEGEVSAIEIGLKKGNDPDEWKEKIAAMVGTDFMVKTRYEQKELLYKTNQTEKLFVFLILVFVLVLAGFNVIASVTMLVIDKQKDADTLQILGMTSSDMRKVFFTNGLLINFIGGGLGLSIGILLVVLQDKFHFITMENAIIDYYPVKLIAGDIIKGFLALMTIALFSSWFPVWLAMNKK